MQNFIHIRYKKCLSKSTQKYAIKVGVPSEDSNHDFLINPFENMCTASSHIKLSNVSKNDCFRRWEDANHGGHVRMLSVPM